MEELKIISTILRDIEKAHKSDLCDAEFRLLIGNLIDNNKQPSYLDSLKADTLIRMNREEDEFNFNRVRILEKEFYNLYKVKMHFKEDASDKHKMAALTKAIDRCKG